MQYRWNWRVGLALGGVLAATSIGCAAENVTEGEPSEATSQAICGDFTAGEEYKATLALAYLARAELNPEWQLHVNPATQIAAYEKACPSGSRYSNYYLPFNDSRLDSLAQLQCTRSEYRLGSFPNRTFTMIKEKEFRQDNCKHVIAEYRTWTRTDVSAADAQIYFSNQRKYLLGALAPFGGASNRMLYLGIRLDYDATARTARTYILLDPLSSPTAPAGTQIDALTYMVNAFVWTHDFFF